MKEYLKTLALILICLAVLIPFASNDPDGLEKVGEILKIEGHEPIWKGLMPDYIWPTIDNPYLSTLLAGIFGTLLVLFAAFILGMALAKPNKK